MPQSLRPYDPFEDPYAGEPLEYDYGSETGAYDPWSDPFAGEPIASPLYPTPSGGPIESRLASSAPWSQTTRMQGVEEYDPWSDPYAGEEILPALYPTPSGRPLQRTTDIELPFASTGPPPTGVSGRPQRMTDITLPPEPSFAETMRGRAIPSLALKDAGDITIEDAQAYAAQQPERTTATLKPGRVRPVPPPPIPLPPEPELNPVERAMLMSQQFGEAERKSALDIVTGIPAGMAAMAYGPEATKLREMDEQMQKDFLLHPAPPDSPEHWAQVLGNVAGSAVGFAALAAPMSAVGGGAATGALMSGGEAMMEASLTAKNLMLQGKSQDEARQAAGISFALNLALNKFTNKAFFDEIGGEPTVRGVMRSVVKEPFQEEGQNEISNVLEGRPIGEGAIESLAGGLAGGIIETSTGRALRGVAALPEQAPAAPGPQRPGAAPGAPRLPPGPGVPPVAAVPPPGPPPEDLESLPPPPPGMVRPTGDIVVGPPSERIPGPFESMVISEMDRARASQVAPPELPSRPIPSNVLQQMAPQVEQRPAQLPPPIPVGPRLISSSQHDRPPHALDDEIDAVSDEQFVDLLEQARTSAGRPGPNQNAWIAWTERLVASNARRQGEAALPPLPPTAKWVKEGQEARPGVIPVTPPPAKRRGGRPPRPIQLPEQQWAGILGRARDDGYTGTEAQLREAYDEVRGRAESMKEMVDTGGASDRQLLMMAAKHGGVRVPRTKGDSWAKGEWIAGEEAELADYSTAVVPTKETKKGGRSKLHFLPYGHIAGVKNVINNESGVDLDTLREAIAQEPGFEHYVDKNDTELLYDLIEAARRLTATPTVAGPKLTGAWWSEIQEDTGERRGPPPTPPSEINVEDVPPGEDTFDFTYDATAGEEIPPELEEAPGAPAAPAEGPAQSSFKKGDRVRYIPADDIPVEASVIRILPETGRLYIQYRDEAGHTVYATPLPSEVVSTAASPGVTFEETLPTSPAVTSEKPSVTPPAEDETLGGFTVGDEVSVTHQGKTFSAVVERVFGLQVTKKRRDSRATVWSAEHGRLDVPLDTLTKTGAATPFASSSDEQLVAEITTLLGWGDEASVAKARAIGVELIRRQPKKKKAKPEKKTATEFEGTSDTDLEAKLTRLVAEGSPTSIVEAQRIGVELIRRQDERADAEKKAAPKAETKPTPQWRVGQRVQWSTGKSGRMQSGEILELVDREMVGGEKRPAVRVRYTGTTPGFAGRTEAGLAPEEPSTFTDETFVFLDKLQTLPEGTLAEGTRVQWLEGKTTRTGTLRQLADYETGRASVITDDGRLVKNIDPAKLHSIEDIETTATTSAPPPKVEDVTEPFAPETPPTPPTGPKVGDRVRYSIGTRDVEGTVTQAWTTTGGEQRVQVTYEPTAADKKMFGARARKDVRSITVDRLLPPKTEDVNEFGETQPRMPGLEDVREQAQKPEPKIEAPFTLERPKGAPPPKAPKQKNVLEMVAGTTGATTEEAKQSLPVQPDEDAAADEQELRYNAQGGPGTHPRPAIDLPDPATARAWLARFNPNVNATTPPPKTDVMTPSAIVQQLKVALEQKGGPLPHGKVPISRGGFKRRAWGIYKPHARTIRVRVVNDLAVIFHESGHAIDAAFGNFASRQWWAGVFQELEALGANTSRPTADRKTLREEGVAELVRLWLTDPARLEQQFPNVLRAFEQQMSQNRPLQTAMLKVRENTQGYLAQDLGVRGTMRISMEGIHPGEENWFDILKRDPHLLVKMIYNRTLDDLGGVSGIHEEGAEWEAYKLMRIARYANGKAEDFLTDHGITFLDGTKARDKKGNVIGSLKAMTRAVEKVGKAERFGNFLMMRHVQEVVARGIDAGISKAEADDFMQTVQSDPHYQLFLDTAEQVYEFQGALLKYMRDAGAISPALYRKITKGSEGKPPYKYYVPMQRSFDVFEKSQGIKRSIVNRGVPIFKQYGSGRDIINPMESIVANTVIYVNAADGNRGMAELYKWATTNEGLGNVLEDIEHSERYVVGVGRVAELMGVSSKEEVEVLDPQGHPVLDPATGLPQMRPKTLTEVIDEHGVDLNKLLEIWKDSLTPKSEFREVLIMVEGEPKLVQINHEMLWDSIELFGPRQTHWFFILGQFAVTVLRFFVTQLPSFIIRNFVRDPFTAMTQGRFGQIPFYDSAKSLIDIWNDGLDTQLVKSRGIQQTTMWGADRSRRRARAVLKNQMQLSSEFELNKKGYKLVLKRGAAFVSGVFQALEAIGVAIELAPRVAEARLFREAGGKVRRPGVMGIFQRGQAFAKTVPSRAEQVRAGGSFRQGAPPWAAEPLLPPRQATLKTPYRPGAIGPMPAPLDITDATLKAAEVTLDFRSGGSWTRDLNRLYAFLNARVKGVHRAVQTAKSDPTALLLNYGTMMALMYAGWLWNHAADDDDEKAGGFNNRHGAAQRQSYWMIRIPGTYQTLMIAKPFEHALPANLLEAALDYMHDKNPVALQQVIHQLPFVGGYLDKNWSFKSIIAQLLPTIALPSFEAGFNFNTWTGRPTVSVFEDRAGGVDPTLQGRDYTSSTLTWLTAKLRDDFGMPGMSPAKLEQFLSGHFGTAGQLITATTDPFFEARAKFDVLQILSSFKYNWRGPVYASGEITGQSDAVIYFYQQYQEMESYKASINKTKEILPQRANVFRAEAAKKPWFPNREKLEKAYTKIGHLMEDMSKAHDDTTLTTDQRVKKIHEIRGQMAGYASAATGTGRFGPPPTALERLILRK